MHKVKKIEGYTIKKMIELTKLLLSRNEEFIKIAIVKLYMNQHPDERVRDPYLIRNFKGFDKMDANILTRIVQTFRVTDHISNIDMSCLKRRLPRYARQLISVGILSDDVFKIVLDNYYKHGQLTYSSNVQPYVTEAPIQQPPQQMIQPELNKHDEVVQLTFGF